MRIAAISLMVLALGACASASKPGAMLAEVTESTLITDNSKLNEAVTVGTVDGGKETNPLWASKVSNDDFADALRQSFAAHAMLATDNGTYRLDAELQKLKQPIMGLDMTVTSSVKYTLTDVGTGAVVFDEVVETPYTAKMGDAFVGVERLRLANEGSIRTNISELIEKLIASVDNSSVAIVTETAEGNDAGS